MVSWSTPLSPVLTSSVVRSAADEMASRAPVSFVEPLSCQISTVETSKTDVLFVVPMSKKAAVLAGGSSLGHPMHSSPIITGNIPEIWWNRTVILTEAYTFSLDASSARRHFTGYIV